MTSSIVDAKVQTLRDGLRMCIDLDLQAMKIEITLKLSLSELTRLLQATSTMHILLWIVRTISSKYLLLSGLSKIINV